MALTEKTLKPGQVRHVAKIHSGSGPSAKWGVYDRARASFPRSIPGYGQVPEGLTETQAHAEAERLEKWRNQQQRWQQHQADTGS